MLRVYFRNNRELLKRLCKAANECLLEYLRQVTHKPDGQLGMVMTIHTFGEYMGFNCHLHDLVADGLFSPNGMFYVAPKVSTKPLEQMFRVRVIKMLVEGANGVCPHPPVPIRHGPGVRERKFLLADGGWCAPYDDDPS